MKQILNRIFHHEELTTEEARVLLLDISNGRYADAQIAALLGAASPWTNSSASAKP